MQVLELIKVIVPTIETFKNFENTTIACQQAFEAAKKHTKRTKLLVLGDFLNLNSYEWIKGDQNLEVIIAGDKAQLCKAIANSLDRIAAIVVKSRQASPYYYKKVRELTSAEGAMMIWDESDKEFSEFNIHTNILKNIQPDIICFRDIKNESTVWIGSKINIL